MDPLRASLGKVVHQQLRRDQHDGQQVVEVVRHATGEPTNRLELVRVLVDRVQFRLEVRDSRLELLMARGPSSSLARR